MHILVIDDEAVFLETLVARLKLRGLEVTGCLEAKKGLELLESRKFDVVLMDVSMPEMDGIKALEVIKNKNPQLPVILLTGHASIQSASRGKEIGAFDYLLKPFPLDDLTDKIEEALKLR